MRAAAFDHGTPVVIDIPDPKPGSRDLLVRVQAAGVNGADLLQAQGGYPPPEGAPDTPGLEVAGEVVEAGVECRRFRRGDRVMAIVPGGAQAELCLVEQDLAIPVPDTIGWPVAGGFCEAFATAHDALFTQAGVELGDRVCIHGAAGGVGSAAVQLAVNAGAHVTATVRNPHARALVAELGCQAVDPTVFVEAGPFDVILELVGAPNWPANLDAVAIGGRICVIGVGAGSLVEIDLFKVMRKRAHLMASTLRARPLPDRALVSRRVEHHAVALLAARKLDVPVAATFSLDDIATAYETFSQPGKFGKIVLVP